VGFLPLWPHPSFEASTVALGLGCWTAESAATLDTFVKIPQHFVNANSTEVLTPIMLDRRVRARFSYLEAWREDLGLATRG
jgi:hypothetical protein